MSHQFAEIRVASISRPRKPSPSIPSFHQVRIEQKPKSVVRRSPLYHGIELNLGLAFKRARSSSNDGEIFRSRKGARIFTRSGKSRVLPTSKKTAFNFRGMHRL